MPDGPTRRGMGSAVTGRHLALLAGLAFLVVVIVLARQSSGTPDAAVASDPTFPPPSTAPSQTTTAPSSTPAPSTTLPNSPATTSVPDLAAVFAATSPFNAPIGDDPALDPRSDRIAASLSETVVADLYEFGIAVYEVDADTTPVKVACIERWGRCPLETGLHRIPSDAAPAPGSDGTLVVVDWSENRTVEMWQPSPNPDGSWTTSWGTTTPLDGSGVPDVFGNGAGVSHLAGVIRVEEIAGGRIDHALVFSTDNPCRDDYRYPATKTDGDSSRADCIPEGARVQLDPSIDLDTLRLTSAEHSIATALQTYGAYAVDTGGAPMAFYFEVASDSTPSYPGSVYAEAGLTNDYYLLANIPWDGLRVLRSWDGT